MPSATKVAKVKDLKERLEAAQAVVFTDFRGLTVQDANELRTALAEVDAAFSVIKNTLAKIAVKEAGLEGTEAFLDGPTAAALANADPVATAKAVVDAAKKFPVLEVKGGWSEGRLLTADDIKALAALESREAMLAKVAGLLKMQMSKTAYLLQALQSKFLSLLEAYKEKVPAGEAPAPAAEEPPAEAAPEAESAEAEPAEAEPAEAEVPAEDAPAAEATEAPSEETTEAPTDETQTETTGEAGEEGGS